MYKLFCVGFISILLSGCTTLGQFTQQEIRQVVINRCPPLINYTPEQQRMAAEELRKLYNDSQISVMITDYGKLREACRLVTNRVNKRIKSKG